MANPDLTAQVDALLATTATQAAQIAALQTLCAVLQFQLTLEHARLENIRVWCGTHSHNAAGAPKSRPPRA